MKNRSVVSLRKIKGGHIVEWVIGTQRFQIGVDCWSDKELAKAYARMFEKGLASFRETSRQRMS